MYHNKLIRHFSTADKLQEFILNYVIYFHEFNRNNYSLKNLDIQNFLKEILDKFSQIYSLVNLYRSELDAKTDITAEIKNIVYYLSQNEFNLKDENARNIISKKAQELIHLIVQSFNPHAPKSYKCVSPGCTHSAISSHTISRSNNFTKGVEFFRFREKKYFNENTSPYELMQVSDRKASAFPLFCSYHDRKIFLPIENGKQINPFEQKHLFLQNWRTFTMHHVRSKEKKDIFMERLLSNEDDISLVKTLNITDYMNSLDGKIYRNLAHKEDFLAMNFTLKNTPPILSSVILDIRNIAPEFIRNNTPFFNEPVNFFYIHILPNGGVPIVNISAFNDPINYQAMLHLYSLYKMSQHMFWNRILQFISTSSNFFLNGSIIYPDGDKTNVNPIYSKIEDLYVDINKSHKDIYRIPDYYKPIYTEFNKREINFLFAHTAMHCNFIDENMDLNDPKFFDQPHNSAKSIHPSMDVLLQNFDKPKPISDIDNTN